MERIVGRIEVEDELLVVSGVLLRKAPPAGLDRVLYVVDLVVVIERQARS